MTVHGLRRTRRLKKAVAKEPGFRELVDFQKGHTSGNVEVIWRDAKGLDGRTRGLRLIMLGDVGTTTVRFGPGYRSDENRPVNMILAQRNRGRSHFVSVLEPLSGLPKLKAARLLKSRWTPTADKPACVVEIDGDNWTDRIEYAPSSPNKPGRWSVTRLQQGRVRFLYCSNGAKSAGTGWVLKCAEPVLGKTGQVKFRRGTPEVLLDMPVTWGKASRGLDLLVGEPSGRLSRYRMEKLTPIGNAAWASLRKDRGIQLSVMRAEEINVRTKRIDSDIPLPRRGELIGKPVVRADGRYFGTIRKIRVLKPDSDPARPDAIHPSASPVRMFFEKDAKMERLGRGEMLRVMDVTLRTPVTLESSALLEETAPDTYRLSAPLGAKLTIPTAYTDTRIRWRQNDGPWQEITPEFSRTKSGFLMSVEFPIEALANGPIEFRLKVGE